MKATYKPTKTSAVAAWEANGAPTHTKPAMYGTDLGDEGMLGSHRADKVMLHNAHPYTEHSVGYEDSNNSVAYDNHGIQAFHVKHGNRDKNPEHHPPLGLWEPDAMDHTPKR